MTTPEEPVQTEPYQDGGNHPFHHIEPLAGFVVTNWMLVQALFIAFFIGILSCVVPSFGAARRSVASTLREVF